MTKKTIIAIILAGLGVIICLLILVPYTLTGGQLKTALPLLALGGLCIVTGTLLAFSKLLDRAIDPVIDEIGADIEDDVQEIQEGRLGSPLRMALLTGVAALAFFFFVFRFHKLDAAWGGIPVIVPTLLGMGALVWLVSRTAWFQDRRNETPTWLFLIPAIGLILSVILGLAKTEDPSILGSWNSEAAQYNTFQFTSFLFQSSGGSLDLDFLSCDGDGCEVFYLAALVIVLVCLLVLGSALIPHFWVLSGTLLIGLMTLIAVHDLLVRRRVRTKRAHAPVTGRRNPPLPPLDKGGH